MALEVYGLDFGGEVALDNTWIQNNTTTEISEVFDVNAYDREDKARQVAFTL